MIIYKLVLGLNTFTKTVPYFFLDKDKATEAGIDYVKGASIKYSKYIPYFEIITEEA